jgi:hypothetical protein
VRQNPLDDVGPFDYRDYLQLAAAPTARNVHIEHALERPLPSDALRQSFD